MSFRKMLSEIRCDEGQANFELIVFMPFFIYLVTVLFNVGDSINASINQQKAARNYHFFLTKGNSTAPSMDDLAVYKKGGLDSGSMVATGWQDKSSGDSPLAPCFKFVSLFGGSDDEKCDEPVDTAAKSSFVKVFTVFGICGATYIKGGPSDFFIRKSNLISEEEKPISACVRE